MLLGTRTIGRVDWTGKKRAASDAERARLELAGRLRGHGIRDQRVLDALAAVPREHFVDEQYRPVAYRNSPLPIGQGQTISQPFVVAFMLQELQLRGDERVLEIGTGSGYQTALLARLVAWVISVELLPMLAERADRLLDGLGYQNVEVHVANGSLGWPAGAPYDAIVVSAAAPEVPQRLLDQLGEGGRLAIPVGSLETQVLTIVRRRGDRFERQTRGEVRFVPLVGEQGWGASRSERSR